MMNEGSIYSYVNTRGARVAAQLNTNNIFDSQTHSSQPHHFYAM